MDSSDNDMDASGALACFHGKIKEAISLVRSMSTEDKLKAVQYWNVVSENLQDVVNSSADDISALQSQLSERENMMLLQQAGTLSAGAANPHQQASSQGITVIRRTEHSNVDAFDFGHRQTGMNVIGPDLIDHYLANQPSVGTTSDGHLALSVVVDEYENLSPCEGLNEPLAGPEANSNLHADPLGTERPLEAEGSRSAGVEVDPLSVPPVDFVGDGSQDFNVNVVNRPVSAAAKSGAQNAVGTDAGEGSETSQNADLWRYLSFAKCGRGNVVMNFFTKQPRSPGNKADNSQVYCCNVCQKVYSNATAFYTHFVAHCERLVCCKCGQTCVSLSLLRHHMLTHNKTLLKCIECGRSFTTFSNLSRHMKTHTGDLRYECTVCHKRFVERKDLRIHSRLHSGERPYQCSLCPARFIQLGALQAHLASHSGAKPHLCDLCGKTFRQMPTLKQHKRRHEGKKGFACDRCPMAFNVLSDLKRHRRSHMRDKPHKCNQCGKSFTRQLTLSEHLNRHYGNKPYQCPLCTKSYADMSACKKHIKTHARDESEPPSPSLLAPNPGPPPVMVPVGSGA